MAKLLAFVEVSCEEESCGTCRCFRFPGTCSLFETLLRPLGEGRFLRCPSCLKAERKAWEKIEEDEKRLQD